MTTRAAALGGLRYFSDVRAIAAQVGVAVPADEELAARFASTDSIDIAALADDAAMLDDVLVRLHGTIDTAHDARRGLPVVWRGEAGEAAEAAVGAHLRSARDVVDGIGTVSSTISAAAAALGRVQDAKHRTLAVLRTDHVAGQAMSTITADDVADDPEPFRSEIAAAVELFDRTMDVVDDTVGVILTAVTDSFGALPSPQAVGPPPQRLATTRGSTAQRAPRARRTDLVVSPTTGPGSAAVGDDPNVVVAAISAGATIAGAALAAASSIGTAAVDGVAGLLTHLVDAADQAQHGDGAPHAHDVDTSADEPGDPASTNSPAPTPAHAGAGTDAAARPTNAPAPSSSAVAEPSPITSMSPPSRPLGSDAAQDTSPVVPTPSTADRSPSASTADDVGARGVPSAGPRLREREPTRGRPDPDDGGGLALAGDR